MNLNSPALLFFRRGEIMLVHYKRNKRQVFSVHTEKSGFPQKLRKTAGFLAEKEGFEPSRRFSRPTAFRVQTLQPLGYFSMLYLKHQPSEIPRENKRTDGENLVCEIANPSRKT